MFDGAIRPALIDNPHYRCGLWAVRCLMLAGVLGRPCGHVHQIERQEKIAPQVSMKIQKKLLPVKSAPFRTRKNSAIIAQ